MKAITTLILLLGLAAAQTASSQVAGPEEIGPALVWTVQGDFRDIKQDIVTTIEAKGLVVSYTAYAANMLARTSEAVEDAKPVYDQGESILFCKADLSHELAQQDPHNIVLCPYSISLYTLVEAPTITYVSVRLPALQVPAYIAVHDLLEQIVEQALGWYR